MKLKHFVMLALLVAVTVCTSSVQSEERTLLNDNWLYLEKDVSQLPVDADSAYTRVILPHTWNSKDAVRVKKYRRAASWYRRYLTFSENDLQQRLYLRFGAAGQRAVVYVNGRQAMEHIGGYSAFTLELTDKVKVGSNRIDVMVTNRHDRMIAPVSGDFNMYGGLYRSVQLIRAPKASICRSHLGGPGFRKWSEKVSAEKADFNISALLDNGTDKPAIYRLQAVLTDNDDNLVSEGETSASVKSGEIKRVNFSLPEITTPALWSPERPTLYKLTLKVLEGDKLLDTVTANHGFRWFKFTPDKGFFLNGRKYILKGVNRHQDFRGMGNALSEEQHELDIKLIKEIGANWLRLAHYQQDDFILDLCDKLGILVWEEIPYVNATTFDPQYERNLRSMMREMIEQHYNNSSIILWGMGNEIGNGDELSIKERLDGKAQCWDIINGLNSLIHQEDPVRKSVFVIGDADYGWKRKMMDIPDVIGYNLYRGWYGSEYDTLTARCEELHSKNPDKPFIIAEFGAGSDSRIHTETPKGYDFSAEYQVNFLEAHLNQIEKMDWLSGSNWWNYANFGSSGRKDSIPHINQKGLVSFDRRKKDSFYLLKSRWSNEPVLYLQAPHWSERSGAPVKEYRVFSNLKEVELVHNGQSLGRQSSGFRWKVILTEGKNTILAKGGGIRHGFDVHYKKSSEE